MLDEDTLRKLMATVLGVPVETIGPDSSQDTVKSWDSLKQMNLVLALEETFGVQIPDEAAAEITSYALIKAALQDLVAG